MIKENTHIVIKREDVNKYLTDTERVLLDNILSSISIGRAREGKKQDNSYYICNTDELYADKVLEVILNQGNGWIPCSERLPERNKTVLCWAKSTARGGDCCFVGHCDNGFWFLQTAIGTLGFPTQYEVVEWHELPVHIERGSEA